MLPGQKPTNAAEFEQAIKDVQVIIDNDQRREELLRSTDDDAQEWLDLFQLLVEYLGITTKLRSWIFKVMIKLSRKSGRYPQCLTIWGVEKLGRHPIGGGAFGDVWKGKVGQELVCLKVIRVFNESDMQQTLKDYMQEATIWRQLNHPNVLPFMGICYLDEQLCLVSPWMERGNLVQYLKNTSAQDVDHDLLAHDVACGLSYLHQSNIVHADLKGVNVLITPDLRACLGDFGLSRVSATQLLLTETSRSKGTTRWTSPELLRDGPNCYPSKESDIYAYACVCYEIYTGRVPFYEMREQTVLLAIVNGNKHPSRPENCVKLHDSMWNMMVECWNEAPSSRPTTSGILARILKMMGSRRLEQPTEWKDPAFTHLWNDPQLPPVICAAQSTLPPDQNPHIPGNATYTEGQGNREGNSMKKRKQDRGTDQRATKRTRSKRQEGDSSLMSPPSAPSHGSFLYPLASNTQSFTTGAHPQPTGEVAVIPVSTGQFRENIQDVSAFPLEFKKEGDDWFAIFNSEIEKEMDISLIHTFKHESDVCCVRFSPDGKYLATGCNQTAQIYDVRTGIKTCVLVDEAVIEIGVTYIRDVCFSPDGKYLATGADDKRIRIWDIAKKQIISFFDGHQEGVLSLDFSSDGRLLASGSGDETVRIWDMTGGAPRIFAIEESDQDSDVTSVAVSPNGQYVAAGSLDTVVRIWDIYTGQLVEQLGGHRDCVSSVAFMPDGKALVSGSLDKTLKYWDLSSRSTSGPGTSVQRDRGEQSRCTQDFTGHKDYILTVAVSHDGEWIASGSEDNGVHFYNSQRGTVRCVIAGHKNWVISVDLSPNGHMLATGSMDCRARIWSYR